MKKFLRLGVRDTDAIEYRWERQNEMLLWIMVVGACAAEGGVEEKWFLERAIHGCRLFKVDTHQDLCNLMSRFIGSAALEAGSLKRLAGHIKNG